MAPVLTAVALIPLAALAAVEVAKVNGKGLTERDLLLSLSGLNEGQRASLLKDPNSRRQVLLGLIDQELLVQEAEKAKLDQDQDFKDALGLFRRNYLTTRLLEKNVGGQLNEKTARKYYDAHKSRYSTDKARVQHILLSDEATARDVLKQAKAQGADFQEIAERVSKDPSAKNNRGELGVITRDSPFVDDFKEAIFSAEEGSIVGPIKTDYGYHVIRVVERATGKPLEYADVELRVKSDYRAELSRIYVDRLKKTAKIQVDEKALGAF
jgi:peptidyl-prolyl cis-trans isomerase C